MNWKEGMEAVFKPLPRASDPHHQRYIKLQELMREKGIDHLLVEDTLDIFYLTGFYFGSASFLAHQAAKPDFMLDSRYFDALNPGYWRAFLLDKGFWSRFWQRNPLKSLAFDPDKTTYSRYQELSDQAADFSMRLEPKKSLLSHLQRAKDESQLKKMQLAGELAAAALEDVCQRLTEGMSEKLVARMIRLFFVERGADVSFEPIVAFGDNSAIPHHGGSNRCLEKGQIVLIDLGAKLDHYCSDMTRTFFFGHVGSPELSLLWQTTYEAYELACSMLRPGVSCVQLDRGVRELFRKKEREERFTHSLGHGIGLRVHEFPRIRADMAHDYQLELGCIITIEPGLYIPGLGGVRLENTLIITQTGAQVLTSTPFQFVV